MKLARQRRDEARQLLARDIDPSAYRKAQKQSKRQWAQNSFEAVAREWLAKYSPNWTTGHARMSFPGPADLMAPDRVVRRIEETGTRCLPTIMPADSRDGKCTPLVFVRPNIESESRLALGQINKSHPREVVWMLEAKGDFCHPNGRAYNRTAILSERRRMMQVWADYLDRLRAGEELAANTTASEPSHTYSYRGEAEAGNHCPTLRLAQYSPNMGLYSCSLCGLSL